MPLPHEAPADPPAVARLRSIARAWHLAPAVESDPAAVHVADLDAVLSALDAAEAECARMRLEPAAYKKERDAALARENAAAVARDVQWRRADAAVAEVARLRALSPW